MRILELENRCTGNVPASSLPEGQRTISLSKVKKLARPVPLTELGEAIDRR
jgi:hypothetical protein